MKVILLDADLRGSRARRGPGPGVLPWWVSRAPRHLLASANTGNGWGSCRCARLYHFFYLVGVKGAEREDPTLQGGDESEAALRHPLGEISGNYILL